MSHYIGTVPDIAIVKHTKGEDADASPGPTLAEGDSVFWEYLVINGGDVLLTGVIVEGDREGPILCRQTALDPGESMTCPASGIATIALYSKPGAIT